MKSTLIASVLVVLGGLSFSSQAADLKCSLNVKSGGNVWGNNTSYCSGIDFSFDNSTSGKFYIANATKAISKVIWNGDASCSGGTTCNMTIRAYRQYNATATILYTDGTYETTNSAHIDYETGF
ncbi:hypothetical protein BB427_10815 [Pseudoalteromonas sp. BMB]|uniref:hypothetical protein n=1 Tax=Pseudoalteromonas sp. BMB TaxID=1874619 RepID=UPI00083D156E|nr:hypothetical protein [Pseudoalteromonas sp. BMB]ODB41997.1 hypothetical protein BB427_10815 [Pseudoalteromonas sp. BMB]